MIGTDVRGLRHLWRLSGPSLKEVLINFRDYGYCFCHVLKTKKESPEGEILVIFNPYFNQGNKSIQNYFNNKYLTNDEIGLVSRNYSRIMEFGRMSVRQDNPYIYNIVMLPENFEEEYNKFLSANAKMIRTLTGKFEYDTDENVSKRIYMYTDGSKNFYQWAISNYFQNGMSLASIRSIMSWNEIYGKMSKNLKKNTITAYTSHSDIMTLQEELRLLRRDKRINDVINMFNTTQKRILRENEFSEKDKETLSKFYRLSDTKKVNFVRKMSTITDYSEIMRQMRHITSTHFDWNKDSFMDFIKNVNGMKYETVFDNGDVVMVKVEDYETVKNLAKTTNWCISKNKTYWNQYVEQRDSSVQYMVFDFSKKEDDLLSIIGFTTEYNKGITHAHDFTNNDMMKSNGNSDRLFLRSFISKFNNNTNIYSVLKNCGIDVNLVAQYDKPLYEWNKETMYKYLYECVNKSNVDVLRDKDNQVVISVKDSNIRYFLGDTYIDNIDSDNWNRQTIIFMDFSMSEYDPNRIQFAIIASGGSDSEDYCTGIYNEHIEGVNASFETKLSQYDLPYDIIRRADNIYVRIEGAFRSFNVNLLKNLLKTAKKSVLEEVIYDYIGSETVIDYISSTITESMSFDMLDAFYDNGIRLTSIIDPGVVGTLLKSITACLINNSRDHNGGLKTPSDEDIAKFLSGESEDIHEAYYIGSYLALKKIIKNENGCGKPNGLYRKFTSIILMSRKSGEVLEDLLMEIMPQLNFSEPHDTISHWVNYAKARGSEKMKLFTEKNILTHGFAKKVWDNASKQIEARENLGQLRRNEDEARHPAFQPYMPQYLDNVVEAPHPAEGEEMWDFLDEDDEEFDGAEHGEVFQEEEAGEPAMVGVDNGNPF